jgi:hypothetical protein
MREMVRDMPVKGAMHKMRFGVLVLRRMSFRMSLWVLRKQRRSALFEMYGRMRKL